MVKRNQAYELFSQGKTKDDTEVKALGLKKDTLRKYYSAWKKLGEAPPAPVIAPPAPVPSEVPLGSLPLAAKFEFKGGKYRVGDKIEDSVVVVKFRVVTSDEGEMWQAIQRVTLHPSVMVKLLK